MPGSSASNRKRAATMKQRYGLNVFEEMARKAHARKLRAEYERGFEDGQRALTERLEANEGTMR